MLRLFCDPDTPLPEKLCYECFQFIFGQGELIKKQLLYRHISAVLTDAALPVPIDVAMSDLMQGSLLFHLL